MASKAPWELTYSVGYTCAVPTAYGTGDTGDEGLLLTEKADFLSGLEFPWIDKTTGRPDKYTGNGFEYETGFYNPSTTMEWNCHSANLAIPLWTMFQGGASEAGAGDFVKTYDQWTSAAATHFVTLIKNLGTGSVSHRLISCIFNEITFSIADGVLHASANVLAYDYEHDRDASADTFTVTEKADLFWKDARVKLGGVAIEIPDFTFTINNGAIQRHLSWDGTLNAGRPMKMLLANKTGVTGSITVPWDPGDAAEDNNEQIIDFLAGTDKTLEIYWGNDYDNVADDGDLAFNLNIRYTGHPEASGDEEYEMVCPFDGVYDGVGDGNVSCQIKLADAVDRGFA